MSGIDALLEGLRETGQELVFPLRSPSVLIPMAFFYALMLLAANAGLLGIWLAIVVLPSMSRYLMVYLEARARDREPETPGIETFSWLGNYWSLFPLVPIIVFTQLLLSTLEQPIAFWLVALVAVVVMPAQLAVLAITHSPLQSLNPAALYQVVRQCGVVYLLAPAIVFLILLSFNLSALLPAWIGELAALYLLFVAFGVCGAVLRPFDIIDEVDIVADEAASERRGEASSARVREKTLADAYAFASRGNLSAALDLIDGALDVEREPAAARRWFFDRMLDWEDTFAALKLAQTMLSEYLASGDDVAAVKLMLRCRMVDHRFLPFADDIPAAVAAAEACDNPELAKAISHGRWQGGPRLVR